MKLDEIYVKFMQNYNLPSEISLVENLFNYLDMMINYKSNLTAIKDLNEGYVYHIIDSIYPIYQNNLLENVNSLVDVGTGGGIPAIPLAMLYPNIEFNLVESITKKTDALNHFKNVFNLNNIIIHNKRIEEFDKENREKFDLSTCRALARADITLEYTAPITKVGGKILLYKGPLYLTEEKNYSDKACTLLGIKEKMIYNYTLEDEKERHIVEYKKFEITDIKYPRRTGIPTKRPIGGK